MLKIIFYVMIIALCTVRFASAQTYVDISPTTAKSMIAADASSVVLDVRNQTEYDAGHIGNAKLIPLYELQERLDELNKTDEIIVYSTADDRSTQASQLLVSTGFLHVYNMLGGIIAWENASYPVYVKYSSIQEAINNATTGDTINVSSGLYYEHILLNRSISVVGENRYNTIIDGSGNGTVLQVNADNVSISHFTIQFCGCSCHGFCGINVEPYHQHVNITDDEIVYDGYGVKLSWTQGAILARNNITQSDYALTASNSSDISIQENVMALSSDGTDLLNSTNVNVSQNTMYHNVYGLYMVGSSNNSIVDNSFDSNQIYGILDGGQSVNNSIFHNNFVSNAYDASTPDLANSWDNGYPSGGNYWSDYIDMDLYRGSRQNETGSDGIWDHPYNQTGGIDHYPLSGPFSTFLLGQWNETSHYVDVVSNSTVSNFNFNSSAPALSFEVNETDGTSGFCRVTVPKDVMGGENTGQWIVTLDGEPIQQATVMEDDRYTYLYFNYTQNTMTVQIQSTQAIPEFSSFLVLLLSVSTALLTLAIYRRKVINPPNKARATQFSTRMKFVAPSTLR